MQDSNVLKKIARLTTIAKESQHETTQASLSHKEFVTSTSKNFFVMLNRSLNLQKTNGKIDSDGSLHSDFVSAICSPQSGQAPPPKPSVPFIPQRTSDNIDPSILRDVKKDDRLSEIMSEISTVFPKESNSELWDESSTLLCPTPIGLSGLQVVPQVPISEGLLPLLDDRTGLSTLLEPLATFKKKDHIRPYQSNQWNEKYQELTEYKVKYGHCNVRYQWNENIPLSQWVKRQRHQYKLKQEGRHSNLSDKREAQLEKLGFVWDSRAAAWEERFEELKAFHKEYGHFRVTKNFQQYRQLAVWLKRQRHQCRLFLAGHRKVGIQPEHVSRLLDLGLNLNCST